MNMKEQSTKYVVLTCISTFRQKYVVSEDELQSFDPSNKVENDDQLITWAKDSVTCEDLEEFSQHWLGEQIVDVELKDEDEVLTLFDKENDYLKDWSVEQKLKYIRNRRQKVEEHE
jgi:tetraacyldisaccharide-1-P 4'-kinase